MGRLSGLVDLVRGTRILPAALLVLGCALSGCGATDPAASDPPSVSPSASPTGPTVPALPSAAREHTKAGAIAFVRHYIDQINYAQATGDAGALRQVGSKSCSSCNKIARFVTRLYSSGGSFRGGHTRVVAVLDALSPAQYGDFVVDIEIEIAPSVVRRDGSKQRAHGGRNTLSVFPVWTSAGWKVEQWSRAK